MNDKVLADRVAIILSKSRAKAEVSREALAKRLGVSAQSIKNWETGAQIPSIKYVFGWFDALDVPIYPYLLALAYPMDLDGLSVASSDNAIRNALQVVVSELSDNYAKELLFLFVGDHGSNSDGILEAITAYLHLPMQLKVAITELVLTNYEMCEVNGALEATQHIMPDMAKLETLAAAGHEAAHNRKSTYMVGE